MREERKLRLFENKVLTKIFGPNRDEVSEERRRMHNEKLYCLHFSSTTIRVIKQRRMGWVRHVACTGERCIQGFGGET